MHVEPDDSTVPEKSIVLIDSGIVWELSSWWKRRHDYV
jgi:hypothetical protein